MLSIYHETLNADYQDKIRASAQTYDLTDAELALFDEFDTARRAFERAIGKFQRGTGLHNIDKQLGHLRDALADHCPTENQVQVELERRD